ncbi:hypothetical protein J2Z65_003976 [Paenibacillus aceris]|uniref:Uncharacterized protein n=1 Tax=Paenibacillus aceris TaxID=869555 RepID=A0ABS4I1G1_9BACL|nr:hypothetical protein [Paenibacillus aceris]
MKKAGQDNPPVQPFLRPVSYAGFLLLAEGTVVLYLGKIGLFPHQLGTTGPYLLPKQPFFQKKGNSRP